ncbi:DNA topoisomerase VI subunit B [archaeon]|nr:DNA topoisomerase VI subunit B [archaeon]
MKKEVKNRTAEDFAKEQREISISEFFLKNKHLLGFDNTRKALLTTIKEAVDNSLDACEDARILPEIKIIVEEISEERFKVTVEDNGPGIVKEQVPKIFAKLLYGSKFHKLKCSRGQQGIGISAAVMYGQLTTGKAAHITSKIQKGKQAHHYELHIDTKKNEPEIINDILVDWNKDRGTKVQIFLEAKYQKGKQGIDEYLRQTAIVNPHLDLTYTNPEKQKIEFPRATKELPKEPKEIKPHPYGVELGILMKMLQDSSSSKLSGFLQKDFCRVSSKVAKEICEKANLPEKARPKRIAKQEIENLMKAIKNTKIMAPPTDCVTPIGEDLIVKGLKKEIDADFYAAVTRPPSVYRGNPFIVEAGIAYGGSIPSDDLIRLLRFANRVPLQYQQSAGAITKSVINTAWRNYGLSQSRGALPSGPVVIMVHIASVWVPFTSESKEAIAHYPEIIKEIKLALQECGRKLGNFIRKNVKAKEQRERINLFENYIPELASSLNNLTGDKKEEIEENLKKILKKGLPELEKNGQTE